MAPILPPPFADFDQNFEAINPGNSVRGAGALYTVRSGDTLQSIAAASFGDASLWYKIAEANGLSGGAALVARQSLLNSDTGPSGRNNAGSFRPYDAASAIGDTQPGAPKACKLVAPAIPGRFTTTSSWTQRRPTYRAQPRS